MDRPLTGRPPRIAAPEGATDTQMHLYVEGFTAAPGAPALPAGRIGPAEYRRVMDWLGVSRVVVTQGNAHGLDNGNLLAAVAALGPAARGVAAVAADAGETELERIHAGGVRGARIMDLPGGAVGLDGLAGVAARVAPLGWVVAVQFDGGDLLDHLPLLEAIPGRYIIDHHGKFFAGVTPDDPRVTALRRLIARGNCWFKFAGCYESSRAGPPDYADVAAVARLIAAENPERVIWGSNWPHNLARTVADYPDDADLFDTVLSWVPEGAARRRVLVDNPAELFGF